MLTSSENIFLNFCVLSLVGVGLVQLCAAWSLTDLSRWRPREVQSAVKQWISAVPASGSDSLCSALRQRMLSIT